MASAAEQFFGGDCRVSLHLLTDRVDGAPPELNPAFAPYREWPDSGLSKFEDLLSGLGAELGEADMT